MRIRPFDSSDADYAALVRINEAAWPDHPDSEAYWRRLDAERDPKLIFRRVMAQTPDGVAGFATWGHNPFAYHPRRFLIDVRVDAERQGRGIGSALHDHVLAALVEHDPVALEVMTREDLPRAHRFLEVRGYALRDRLAATELDVGRFDPEAYRSLFDRLEARGIAIRTWPELGTGPDSERRLYELMDLLHRDVPMEEEHTPEPFKVWLKAYRDNPDFLPETLFVASDGDLWLGMSQIWGSQASGDIYYTGFTGVRRQARRQGIATALKVASIGSLPPAPRGPFVRTQNLDTNPMLSINLRLGFEPKPALLYFARHPTPR